jgi:hypothetical protein
MGTANFTPFVGRLLHYRYDSSKPGYSAETPSKKTSFSYKIN